MQRVPITHRPRPRKNAADKSYNRRRLKEIMGILARYDITHGLTPEKLRKIIEELGPTFVKLGQVISMRQDILPVEYCEELTKLRTDVNPMDFGEVEAVITEEYGKPLSDVFLEIDSRPLGSASIAQVHRAVLKDGSDVVVKVQRPGIREIMGRDIALLERASSLLKLAGGTGNAIDFKMVLEEMWFTAQQEMDFMMEANNMDKFAELNEGIAYIASPKINHMYTTSKVLVMEYISGIQIDDIDALKIAGYDLKEISQKLAENYIKQIIDDGFFQADPHPGNLYIRDGKIVWIDLGMMGTLTNRDKELFRQAIAAVASQNVAQMKEVVLALAVHTGHINHTRLYSDLNDILKEYGTQDFAELNIGDILQDLMRVCNDNGLSMPKGVTMLARGAITLEGVLTILDPQTNIIKIMVSHMSRERLDNFDMKRKTMELVRDSYRAGKSLLALPTELLDLCRMTIKGETKINLDFTGSEEPLSRLDQMINKLVICIITAALLIGSSFISTTDMTPKILGIPALGVLGYLASMVLGLNLVYRIHKEKKS